MCINIIAIGGPSGVGKSEISKRLSDKYKISLFSVGSMFRDMARNRNVDIYDMSKTASKSPLIDLEITSQALKKLEEIDKCVINGHGICLFLNGINVLKILLYAPLEIRAKRIAFRDMEDETKIKICIEQHENDTIERFMSIYGKNLYAVENYDLMINSEKYSLDDIENIISNVIDMKEIFK